MREPVWSTIPLEWRYETTIALCRVALHSPDPDEQVDEFCDELADAEAQIAFVRFAWANIRTMPAFMCEMEIHKVRQLANKHRAEQELEDIPF